MTEFTASNGITIWVRDGGTVQFQHGSRQESCGILQVFPHSQWWQTLREFFQHEHDKALGRWRWPENPDYVVYTEIVHAHELAFGLHLNLVILRESDGAMKGYCRVEDEGREPASHRTEFIHAARAYFDAHPEPKPWESAEPGEVWELTVEGVERTYAAIRSKGVRDSYVRMFPTDDPDTVTVGSHAPVITAGRRIYPEGTK